MAKDEGVCNAISTAAKEFLMQTNQEMRKKSYLETQRAEGSNINVPRNLFGNYMKPEILNTPCFTGGQNFTEPPVEKSNQINQIVYIQYDHVEEPLFERRIKD